MKSKWLIFAICWLAGTFAGMDANLFSVMLPTTIADLIGHSERGEVLRFGSYVLSCFLMGWMLGGILMGMISDFLGRVKTLMLSILLYSVFTGLAAFSESIWMFAITRFFVGLGVGGTMLGISIFLAESWKTGSRAVALALLVASYQVGVLTSGFAAHLFPNWRVAFAIGVAPAFLVWAVGYYFQEPEVWQKRNINREATSNRKHLWLGGMIFGSLLIGYWASLAWVPTWIQDLLGEQATGQEKNYATMLNGMCAIVGCLVAGPLADAVGRRLVIAFSYTGALAISLWLFLGQASFSPAIYSYYGALGFCIGMAQAVMYLYLPELFSTKMRATCVGICLNSGRIVTALAVLCMGLILEWLGGYVETLSLFSVVYLVGAVLALFAPETKAKELPS